MNISSFQFGQGEAATGSEFSRPHSSFLAGKSKLNKWVNREEPQSSEATRLDYFNGIEVALNESSLSLKIQMENTQTLQYLIRNNLQKILKMTRREARVRQTKSLQNRRVSAQRFESNL